MKHYLILSLLLVLSLLTLSLAPAPREPLFTSDLKPNGNGENPSGLRVQTDWGKMPLYFIANQGQLGDQVSYYVQGHDKTLYFTPQGVTLAMTSPQRTSSPSPHMTGKSLPSPRMRRGDGGEVRRWIVKLDFVGANLVQPLGQQQTQAVISYFKGSPDEWHTGLPTYSKIVYSNL
jgi:hypothetical protein